jgi:Undecaprenyl-phosphate galactose phosphotransferase WbaP
MSNLYATAAVNEPISIKQFAASRRRSKLITAVLLAADLLTLTSAWSLSVALSRYGAHPAIGISGWSALILVPVITLAFAASDLYPAFGTTSLEELKVTVQRISFVHAGYICSLWTTRSRFHIVQAVIFWAASILLVPLGRSAVRNSFSRLRWWGEAVLLIGSGHRIGEMLTILRSHPEVGFRPTALLNECGPGGAIDSSLPCFHHLEAALSFARQQGVQTAIAALDANGSLGVLQATTWYGGHFPKLIIVPPVSPRFNFCARTGALRGFLSIQVSQRLSMPSCRFSKRCLDLVIAIPALLLLLPLFVLISVAIKLTSPGNLFFGHQRIGRADVPFQAWKFRTMVSDADTVLAERLATDAALRTEWERDHKLRNDPRVTVVGAILRKFSLDELPQLWNVLYGEMSIVGPRPICSAEAPKYAEYLEDYLRVLPGITGLWQVSGRNETTYDERVQLDAYYVNNWSPWLDLYIVVRTFKAVLSARGAY